MFRKICSSIVMVAFLAGSALPVRAQSVMLPEPAKMIGLSENFKPCLLRGIKLDAADPFRLNFVVDAGDSGLEGEAFNRETERLVRYFLASLTTPEKDLWVNLSPYENDRIVEENFGRTEMGRDLLALDYVLKQITSSLMYPDSDLGKKFWDKIYKKAYDQFGTTDVPLDTFNKVWIVPEHALVFENSGEADKSMSAYIDSARLKVMLETDYLATEKNLTPTRGHEAPLQDNMRGFVSSSTQPTNLGLNTKALQGNPSTTNDLETQALAQEVIRSVILPALEEEVNEGKHFAELRQLYHSLLLSVWFKKKWRNAVVQKVPDGKMKGNPLSMIFMDKQKTAGVETLDPKGEIRGIYMQYVEAFQKGVYNLVREDRDIYTDELIPRKYFSGGANFEHVGATTKFQSAPVGYEAKDKAQDVTVDLAQAGSAANDMQALLKKRSRRYLSGYSFVKVLSFSTVFLSSIWASDLMAKTSSEAKIPAANTTAVSVKKMTDTVAGAVAYPWQVVPGLQTRVATGSIVAEDLALRLVVGDVSKENYFVNNADVLDLVKKGELVNPDLDEISALGPYTFRMNSNDPNKTWSVTYPEVVKVLEDLNIAAKKAGIKAAHIKLTEFVRTRAQRDKIPNPSANSKNKKAKGISSHMKMSEDTAFDFMISSKDTGAKKKVMAILAKNPKVWVLDEGDRMHIKVYRDKPTVAAVSKGKVLPKNALPEKVTAVKVPVKIITPSSLEGLGIDQSLEGILETLADYGYLFPKGDGKYSINLGAKRIQYRIILPGVSNKQIDDLNGRLGLLGQENVDNASINDVKDVVPKSLKAADVGGIDLNTDRLQMLIKGNGGNMEFEMTPQDLLQLNKDVRGFVPIIINVTPIDDVPAFLNLLSLQG